MRPWQTLRFRLIAAYAGLIILGFGGLAFIAGEQISSGTIEDYKNQLAGQAVLVARGLREPVEKIDEGELSNAQLAGMVADFAGQFNTHITLLDKNGRAWLDSSGNLPHQRLPEAPEVAAALNAQVIDDTRLNEFGVETVYAAAPVTDDGTVLAIVQISAPLADARQVVTERWLTLAGGVLLLALLSLAASLWLSNSFTRPLTKIRQTALNIAGGDFSQRLPIQRRDELGQLADAFNHMAAEVQSMIEEQRAFASNAAHELRTPLTAIRLRSEALREGQLDPAITRQYIAEIDDETARLGNLVQDLILLSRMESGRFQPGEEMVDPVRLSRNLFAQFLLMAREREISLTLDVPASLPPVTASVNHLRVVFRNLLSNALKYTPPGGKLIWQMTVRDGRLHAAIQDTGTGIAAEDLPHIFERFYRADKARTREVAGVGLGLSLVKTIVESYGGETLVSSPGLGQGTTVEVWWPLESSQSTQI